MNSATLTRNARHNQASNTGTGTGPRPQFRATSANLKEGVKRSSENAEAFNKTGKLPSYS